MICECCGQREARVTMREWERPISLPTYVEFYAKVMEESWAKDMDDLFCLDCFEKKYTLKHLEGCNVTLFLDNTHRDEVLSLKDFHLLLDLKDVTTPQEELSKSVLHYKKTSLLRSET